jgi:DNA-binding CsgD family transcriptional regulator
VIFAAVITIALLLFTGYYNRYIHHLQIASGYTDYNVYSWPRLLMIPTVIAFGFVGDIKKGRFLPLVTVCVSAIALLNTSLLGRETYLLNMSLYYVALTASIAYYHLTFLRLAPNTKHPALWACMGRVLDSAAVILSFVFRFDQLSQTMVLVIDIVCLAVVVVMISLRGGFDLASRSGEQKPERSDPFVLIRDEFGITPSELRVLRELVLTDDKQDVIAQRLSISVSTLRHHVTSIYKKTGAQTRSALCKLTASKEGKA